MATTLPKIVGGTLEQVVGHPAMVGYHASGKDEFLGHFSDVDDESRAQLTLSISRDIETEAAYLIYLRVPFTRPRWKCPKDLYLVIPVEKLQLEPDIPQADDIPQAVSESLRKDDQILRVVVKMKNPMYAVMPSLPQTSEARLEDVQHQLLRHWKSLTNHDKIDVYLSDVSILNTFRDFSMEIQNVQSATSKLDLDRVYQGCQGMINNWEQYPYKRSHSQPSPQLGHHPPPYSGAPPQELPESALQPGSETPTLGLDDLDSPELLLYWKNTPPSTDDTYVFKDADHVKKRKALEELDRSSRYSAKSPAMARIIPGTPTEMDSDYAASARHSSISPEAELHRESETPLQWRPEIDELKETARLSSRRRGGNVDHGDGRLLARLEAPAFDVELQELVLKMWDYDLNAHDSFRDQLLHLGFLAYHTSPNDDFDTAKMNLQTAFLKRLSNMVVLHRHRPTDLQADASRFRNWLESRISRNASMLLIDSLRDLYWCCSPRKVGLAAATEGDVKEFLEKKARCCALAFILFGKKSEG